MIFNIYVFWGYYLILYRIKTWANKKMFFPLCIYALYSMKLFCFCEIHTLKSNPRYDSIRSWRLWGWSGNECPVFRKRIHVFSAEIPGLSAMTQQLKLSLGAVASHQRAPSCPCCSNIALWEVVEDGIHLWVPPLMWET